MRSDLFGLLVLALWGLTGCGGSRLDAKTRAGLPHSSEPTIELQETRRNETYPVHGHTAEELHQAMLAYSKDNWDGESVGRTYVGLAANLRCREYSDGGAIEGGVLNLDLVVTLPRWPERDRANRELQQKWDQFIAALEAHEEGHVAIAQKHATNGKPAFEELKPQPSCSEMADSIRALSEQLGKRALDEERQYDDRTQHGVLQGCRL
jgi:predicted secreted Zn-dependent protease